MVCYLVSISNVLSVLTECFFFPFIDLFSLYFSSKFTILKRPPQKRNENVKKKKHLNFVCCLLFAVLCVVSLAWKSFSWEALSYTNSHIWHFFLSSLPRQENVLTHYMAPVFTLSLYNLSSAFASETI